jgi:protein TonB
MAIILSVVALVALISIYDHFSARTWQQVTSVQRNEVVFEHRNREYGAYQMRSTYNLRVLLIILIMIFGIGSAYAVYRIVSGLNEEKIEKPEMDLTQFSMDVPEIKEPLDPEPEQEIPPMEKTVQFLEPVITDEPVDVPPAVTEQFEDAEAGKETNEEDNAGFEVPKEKPVVVVVEKPKEPEIHTYVDEPAEFPGGINAMRSFLRENLVYPQVAQELGLEGKCQLKFVVSAKGNISNVEVMRGVPDCPECDKEAVRVVKLMPAWKPGKIKGQAVNSTFNLPVSFKLQN